MLSIICHFLNVTELLEAVDKIHISTEQIVISIEAKNSLCTGGFLASVIKAFFTLETTPKTKGNMYISSCLF